MGHIRVYYKRTLQQFAYILFSNEDNNLAKTLLKEKSEKTLEDYILKKKEELSEKEFYFKAGNAAQYILEEAYKDSHNAINAALNGLNKFKNFIELTKE